MTGPDYAALARQVHDTGTRLAATAQAMEAASFHADRWPPARLREVADALRGAALRAAMAADDTHLMAELTGRGWTRLHRPGRDPLDDNLAGEE